MGAKRKIPMTGSYVVIEHKNSSQTYLFDGTCLIDSVTNTFVPENNESWEKYWDTTKWRFANKDEYKAYMADLYEHGFYYDANDAKIKEAFVEEIKDANAKELKTVDCADVESKDVDIDRYFSTTTINFSNEYPCGVTFRCESDNEVAYKAELVRLYELLEDISVMAKFGFLKNEKSNDPNADLFCQIAIVANRRKRKVKTDGNNLFFNDVQLTDDKNKK